MQQQHFTPGSAPCSPSLNYKFQVISQSALITNCIKSSLNYGFVWDAILLLHACT